MSQSSSSNPPPPLPSSESVATEEGGILLNDRRVTQVFVLLAFALCFWIFSIAGQWVDFPVEYKHGGSVLFQSMGIVKLIVFWVILIVCTLLATVMTGWRWFLAGLFCACLGAGAWMMRGGVLHYVLFSASSPSVFFVLAGEQVLLVGGVALLWLGLWQFQLRRRPICVEPTDPGKAEQPDESGESGDPVYAIITQILAMGILVLLLGATDRSKQVGAAVFIGAACATALAQTLQKKAPGLGRWYWVGPMVVGLIGYIGCGVSSRGWEIGQPIGTLAPLARALPICYASLGIAGALFGYWMTMTDLSENVYVGAILAGVPAPKDTFTKKAS